METLKFLAQETKRAEITIGRAFTELFYFLGYFRSKYGLKRKNDKNNNFYPIQVRNKKIGKKHHLWFSPVAWAGV